MKLIVKTLFISVLALAVLAGAGYWFIHNLSNSEADKISAVAEEIEKQTESQDIEEASAPTKDVTTEKRAHVGMDEKEAQVYLHEMTHQKVVADDKIGAVEMSSENIKNMLIIVKANHDSYEHSDFYEKTLTAWEKGDFSNAVSEHNTIWKWLGGTVGRATGLMSQEQEQEYVEKNFK